jgi:hypothetical protein
MDRPKLIGVGMRVQTLDFGSAAPSTIQGTLFASDVEKGQDGLFQQPAKCQSVLHGFVSTGVSK